MGMGEPLANFKAVWAAVEAMNRDLGLAARHLTISTVGVVPGIRQLADKPLQVNLAVSLARRQRRASRPSSCRSTASTRSRELIARLRGVPGRHRQEDLLRVGLHRRGQRPPLGCPRARCARTAARRPCQPHPAQPDPGRPVARPAGLGPARVLSLQAWLREAGRQRHDPPEPGPLHRGRLRPARRRRHADRPRLTVRREHVEPADGRRPRREKLQGCRR